MTTTKDLLERGFIELEDDITFRTHADVLRLFGRDYKNYQGAFPKHPHEPGVHIWFPIFYQDDDNDWENTFGLNEETVFERRKNDNEGYLTELISRPDRHKRILFAKIERFGRIFYRFKGIYEFDSELAAKAEEAVYRRTVTTVSLHFA
jgi:hypothetical protein